MPYCFTCAYAVLFSPIGSEHPDIDVESGTMEIEDTFI